MASCSVGRMFGTQRGRRSWRAVGLVVPQATDSVVTAGVFRSNCVHACCLGAIDVVLGGRPADDAATSILAGRFVHGFAGVGMQFPLRPQRTQGADVLAADTGSALENVCQPDRRAVVVADQDGSSEGVLANRFWPDAIVVVLAIRRSGVKEGSYGLLAMRLVVLDCNRARDARSFRALAPRFEFLKKGNMQCLLCSWAFRLLSHVGYCRCYGSLDLDWWHHGYHSVLTGRLVPYRSCLSTT